MGLQAAGDLRSDDAGAHDQHRLAHQPSGASPALRGGQHDAAEAHAEQREQPCAHDPALRRRVAVDEQAEHLDGHRPDGHGADHRNHPVEHQRAQPRAVQPAQVEQQHDDEREGQERRTRCAGVDGALRALGEQQGQAEEQEVDGRAQQPPAGALQRPLQAPAEGPAGQRLRLRRGSRQLSVKGERG